MNKIIIWYHSKHTPVLTMDSLWVVFVDRSINADSGAQFLCGFVISDLPQHSRQRGSTEMGRARRNNLTHPLRGHTVFRGRVQSESSQHLLCTHQTFVIPAEETMLLLVNLEV